MERNTVIILTRRTEQIYVSLFSSWNFNWLRKDRSAQLSVVCTRLWITQTVIL